ncbi:hypothetical protein GCM10023224_05460 [Streptomonospora halophila]|uniref:Uncharacterized protein n=1 Tax=Streptomonospora halophila TaxID=427369 RepID=A0ABP9GE46_9ACTN
MTDTDRPIPVSVADAIDVAREAARAVVDHEPQEGWNALGDPDLGQGGSREWSVPDACTQAVVGVLLPHLTGQGAARPDLDAIAARKQAASKEVARLCNGGRWEMRVPARPDADSDMVISRSLSDIDVLTAEVRRLTAELTDAEYGAQRALTQILELRELRKQASDHITELNRELETARREERERCAAAVEARAHRESPWWLRELVAEGANRIRALPDATPTTEETQ